MVQRLPNTIPPTSAGSPVVTSPQPISGGAGADSEREVARQRERLRAENERFWDEIDDKAQVSHVRVPDRQRLLADGGGLVDVKRVMFPWEIDAIPRDQLWWMLSDGGRDYTRLSAGQVRQLLSGEEPPWTETAAAEQTATPVDISPPAAPTKVRRGKQDPRPKLPQRLMMNWLRHYQSLKPPRTSTSKAITAAIKAEFRQYAIPRDYLEGGIRTIYGRRQRGRRPGGEES